jgi:3',5'-cyclic AMP phosphodiesterase CpdA
MLPRILLGGALLALSAGCHSVTLRPAPTNTPLPGPSGVDLLLVADLQYHVPYEEIALPALFRFLGLHQGRLERIAGGFYRHVARSTFLPEALEWTLRRAKSRGIRWGIAAGDLADLGCVAELDAVLRVLRRHPEIRFVIALGNHDVAPIGSLSPRRTARPSPQDGLPAAAAWSSRPTA